MDCHLVHFHSGNREDERGKITLTKKDRIKKQKCGVFSFKYPFLFFFSGLFFMNGFTIELLFCFFGEKQVDC